MPCGAVMPKKHRQKLVTATFRLPLAVARKVKRQDIEREPEARKAVDVEFNKLATQSHPDGKGNGVCDIKTVREKRDVRWEANKLGIVVFFAMIAKLCFQKGSELEDGHPGKVYKGRHVLLGDQVIDNQFDHARFRELGSSPPSMMASRVIDAIRRLLHSYTAVHWRRTRQRSAHMGISAKASVAKRVGRQAH